MKCNTLTLLACALLCGSSLAQEGEFTFGVSWRSVVLSQSPDGQPSQIRINEGDILTFGGNAPGFGNLNNPARALGGDLLGLTRYGPCANHPPNTPCGIEVDAISQGFDQRLSTTLPFGLRDLEDIWFSTDEFAVGLSSLSPPPTVLSEGGQVGDISTDIWVVTGLGPGPLGPAAGPGTHVGTFDGNGLPSVTPLALSYPGIGLTEPNTPGVNPPNGDNLDSLNIDALPGFPLSGYYISVDSDFVDPLTGIPNSGTNLSQVPTVSSADVLFVPSAGQAPTPYAPALTLGLDFEGVGSDDIDALVIAENHVPGFQVSSTPYDWTAGTTDMVLFSVRRGSAVIGKPDSIFGAPIEAGDILTAPLPPGAGGLSPFPGILYAAETLGLVTRRSGGMFGDDLNALDIARRTCFDCNNNGVEDSVDISTGSSTDTNGNGVPDECEHRGASYCDGSSGSCPGGVIGAAGHGCPNSNTSGNGALLKDTGSANFSIDTYSFEVTDGAPSKPGIMIQGATPISYPGGNASVPNSAGLFCVAPQQRGMVVFTNSSGAVTITEFKAGVPFGTGAQSVGNTTYYQFWQRDPFNANANGGAGSGNFNFSNAIETDWI